MRRLTAEPRTSDPVGSLSGILRPRLPVIIVPGGISETRLTDFDAKLTSGRPWQNILRQIRRSRTIPEVEHIIPPCARVTLAYIPKDIGIVTTIAILIEIIE